jgi:UDP-N-acetylglucosamine:LPS N-acetylglucosamine transferase
VSDPGLYLVASDIVISRGGRTSVTDLEYLGIPSIVIPIKNYFEQEFLSNEEARLFPNIIRFDEKWGYKRLLKMVEKALETGRMNNPPKLFSGDNVMVKILERLLE